MIQEQQMIANNINTYLPGEHSSTPIDIALEMVNRIPVNVLSNPDSKFLDPSAGVGTIANVLFTRLLEYHDKFHILNNMIYLVEINAFKAAVLKKLGFINVYKEDFLKKEFNMTFDYALYNPPYQDKKQGAKNSVVLYDQFIYKVAETTKHQLVVLPGNFLKGNKGPLKRFRKYIKNNGIKEISESKAHYFPSVNTADIVVLDIEKGSTNTSFSFQGETITNDFKDTKFLKEDIRILSEKLTRSELEVQRGGTFIWLKETDRYSETKNDEYSVPMFCKLVKGEPKIVYIKPEDVSYTLKFNKVFTITLDWDKVNLKFNNGWFYDNVSEWSANPNFLYFNIKEGETEESFLSFIQSKVFKFLLKISDNGSRPLLVGQLKKFPRPDFTKVYTDQDLYEMYGISNEEVELIETTIA